VIFSIAFFVDSVPFTRGVIDGVESLGGSESACLGLARALHARGHRVTIYASKLDPAAKGPDRWGVPWCHAEELAEPDGHQDWDVFCSLRMPAIFNIPRTARLRLLWNQDLMNSEAFKNAVMACAWAYDQVVYVSAYHRTQWEEWIPELKPLGYVTRNGFNPEDVPAEVHKDPNRIIHISRPERGLDPLLEMWPLLKFHRPQATLHLCRYSSMYDADGWGEVCARFDRRVQEVNRQIGGITYLGELGKADLYRAIAEAAVMWYPGVPTFAETSCIAAIEAQANGTPFVGSLKGALPETVPSGILIPGSAYSRAYQEASVQAVCELLDDCAADGPRYRELQRAGRAHVTGYTYAALAIEWERWLEEAFQTRYAANRLGVLRQLLHYDDHTAAQQVAAEILTHETQAHSSARTEAEDALALCARVMAGKEQSADDYAERAADPFIEAEKSDRFRLLMPAFAACTHVLDLACGPGSFALALTKAYPDVQVTGVDYSAQNIETARNAAEQWDVADRCTFIAGPVYDFDTQRPYWLHSPPINLPEGRYDGAFIGEFLEHCADAPRLIDAIEQHLVPGSPVVFTVPYGPLGELIGRDTPHRRGHVHHWTKTDLVAVFGAKQDLSLEYLGWSGVSPNGYQCGTWIVAYRTSDAPTGQRPYTQQIVTTRPRHRVSVGIIAKNAEFEIGKCLDSVWGVADEIVVGLCGSTDHTKTICETFDAGFLNQKVRVIELGDIEGMPDGFAQARNAVLAACQMEWFFWIDTDEVLVHGYGLKKYLEGGPYTGYVLRQNHLQLDADNHFDTPVRVFKRRPDIQFYGCVHEQPQMGDCNGDILPALECGDAQIAHTGYLVATVRRQKLFQRNLPLVARDQTQFPHRRLGKVLVARDCVHLGDEECRLHNDRLTPEAEGYYRRAIQLFEDHFKAPDDKYHELARPFYERALQAMGIGTEVEWAFAGKPGGLKQASAKPHRIWVRTAEELDAVVQHKLKKAYVQMSPGRVHVDPYTVVPTPAQEMAQ